MIALLAAAALFVGHPVDVRCPAWPDPIAAELGPATRAYTWFDAGTPTYTAFRPDECADIERLLADPDGAVWAFWTFKGVRSPYTEPNVYAEGEAVLTFLHELEHQRLASRDEGIVECAAFRAMPGWLTSIGSLYSRGLMLQAATWLHVAKPAAYRAVC